ncbi:hypothetical protein VTO42DRAFT_6747 [Malbranchea cinnamomea]
MHETKMTEVDVAPTIERQDAHAVQPTSPKKRLFHEIDDADEKTETGPATSSIVSAVNDPPPTAQDGQCFSTLPSESTVSQQARPELVDNAPNPATLGLSASNSFPQQPIAATNPAPTVAPTPPASAPPPSSTVPNKRAKLSPEEKLARERQKAEEKARKEEEKRQREEEKRKREEEREAKRKQKEEERQAKEEEKRKKEEEKKKKERSQMKLNAFFTKPAAPKPWGSDGASKSTADGSEAKDGSENQARQLSDYEKEFPPFFLQSYVKVAPTHRFERDSDSIAHIRGRIDKYLQEGDVSVSADNLNFTDLFQIIPYKRRQGKMKTPTVKEIVMSMNESVNHIDLITDDGATKHTTRHEDLLKQIPMKTLKFHEDVRPPYQGTFTKRLPDSAAVKLCRNPFARVIDELNYDYDSEAEWEEPEEGEDLDSDGEDETSDDGDDDMADFLDDSEDQVKRRTIIGDLEPVCSGIRWDNGNGVDPVFQSYRMEVISETLTFPIDPFSDAYWQKPTPAPTNNSQYKVPLHPSDASAQKTTSKQQQLLQPNRSSSSLPPSGSTSRSDSLRSLLNGSSGPSTSQKARAPFPPDQVDEFKEIVSGSDLTKAGLIEVLKKRFPKVSKDTIKDTLTAVAVRRGQKEADKRWVLI